MKIKQVTIRLMIAFVMGCLGTIAIFGIVLSLVWYVGGNTPSDKLTLSILSAAFAFFSGGIIVAWLAGSRSLVISIVFGLALGTVSFGYIFGLDIAVFPLTSSAAFLSGIGAWFFHRITRARIQSPDFNSVN